MKKYLSIFLLILLLPTFILADIAVWVSKTEAEKTAVFLKTQKEFKFYQEGDTKSDTEKIKEVKAEPVPDDASYWHVLVNGEDKDLAYIYYKTGDGHWRNVAIAEDIKVEGMDIKAEVAEFIPDSVVKNSR